MGLMGVASCSPQVPINRLTGRSEWKIFSGEDSVIIRLVKFRSQCVGETGDYSID